jgi:hypothetical protein
LFKIDNSHKKKTEKKAYSSEVERTAHNGLVVGSNPAKPKKILILYINGIFIKRLPQKKNEELRSKK